jgi:sterol desaturase/sphingolipid hydroxylase (fatty acid hydroxylase superfamily)
MFRAGQGPRPIQLGLMGAGLAILLVALEAWRSSAPVSSWSAWLVRSQASLAESETAAVYVSPLFWGSLVVVLVIEAVLPGDATQPLFSRGFFMDALYFGLNMAFRAVVISGYVALLKALYDRHLDFLTIEAIATWPAPGRLALAILVVDVLAWFHHWVRHRVPVLWRFHAVHHSQQQMNLFTDLRYHPVEYLVTVTLVALPMFVLQEAFPIVFAFSMFVQAYTKFYHANIRIDLGPLRHLLVTPQSHRIHHSVEPRHQDTNFGVIFSVWDRLFGTVYRGPIEYPPTGIADRSFPGERGSAGGLMGALLAQLRHPVREWWP